MASDSDTLQFASMVVYEGAIYVSINIGSRAKKPERQVGCFLIASYRRVESFVGCWREYI